MTLSEIQMKQRLLLNRRNWGRIHQQQCCYAGVRTGKELFAHAIHNGSNRKYNKFVRVNCAAISETLLESELFGYEEGAFSGAKRGENVDSLRKRITAASFR